jgi:16S rRNA A1518/A1519 N6-dimethyltransferase RsmA/KsgA/DIM1 with predicted DNA glycosylase/AP lyase activity
VSGRYARTRARLAQNLFAADAPARRLVAAANLAPGDVVYDLGAGTGRVTAALLATGARVVAVERDPNLARKLRARFAAAEVRVVEADLADVGFAAPYKVVANAPFNQTAVLLGRLLFDAPAPEAATLVLQREAAQRYAGVRTSALSLMAQPWFELGVTCPFSRRDFVPAPGVDVAVLHLARRAPPRLGDAEASAWRGFVRTAFDRGRPEARRTFRGVLSNLQWRRLSRDLAIAVGATCGELTLDQWLGLYRFIAARTPPRQRLRALGG